MQSITIAGNVGKDAVIRTTGSGDNVASFSVAVDGGKDRDGNKRPSTWYDCSLWGRRGGALCQYLTKGTKVTVMGRPSVRVHDDKAYMGVSVSEITLQGGNQGGSNESRGGYGGASGGRHQASPQQNSDLNDEIPF